MSTIVPRYGQIDRVLAARLLEVPPEQDGPLLMLNLMKYRPLAVYTDGRTTSLTGVQADDLYAPLEILHDLGAEVLLFGDVVAQPRGDEQWDRVAVVRYPTAAAFMAMQVRPDFLARHEHKDAGMERTVIAVCYPDAATDPGLPDGTGHLVLDLVGDVVPAGGAGRGTDLRLRVEGAVVGDGRAWTTARFRPLPPDGVGADDLLMTAGPATTVVVAPLLNRLAESIGAVRR